MEKSKVTAKVVHDTRRMKQGGTYPLKLRVTHQREYKDYRIGIDLSTEDYAQIIAGKTRNDRLREIKVVVQSHEAEMHKMIKALPAFSFTAFEKGLKGDGTVKANQSIYDLMEGYIKELENEDRISTSSSYQNALNSLRSFSKKLRYDEITKEFLERYVKHMLHQGKSATTVGIYLRSFRTIVNKAIDLGFILRNDYPFRKKSFQIPNGRNVKKALKLNQIEKVVSYPTLPGTNEDRAKDLWLFSYLCNGMNITDICRLRYRDINTNTITFIRAKTERTSRSSLQPITVKPVSKAFEIISKWGNLAMSKDTYVFPFLNGSNNALDERRLIKNLTRSINHYMIKVGQELGFDGVLTTYVARHSYSTVLKRSNAVSIAYISESLGHRDLKTTQHYLDRFEEDDLERYGRLLLNFDTALTAPVDVIEHT